MKSKIITRIALILSLIVLLTSTVQTTFGFIYTNTNSITGAFMPEVTQSNSLTINKTVRHSLGDNYKIPVSFNFEVSLGAYYANAKLTTSQGAKQADQSGNLSVQVFPGTPFVISDLKVGTVVTVRELSLPPSSGFTPENNVTEKQVAITDSGVSVDFVNVYAPASVSAENVNLSGIKVLEGRPWQEGDSFSFVLEQKTGDSWTPLGAPATVTYSSADGFNRFDMSALLDDVVFNNVGEYLFRVYEQQGDLADIDYDKTVKEFKITVTDTDMDGKLEIASVSGAQNVEVTKDGEQYNLLVTFNNTFKPFDPEPVQVTVTANKTVNNLGTLTVGPDGFEMVLKNIDTNQTVAVKTVNGKAVFDLTFDKTDIGTHRFKLYETNQGLLGMTYDDARYDITVAVTMENNSLKVTVNDQDTDRYAATFINVYDADREDPTPTGDTDVTFWLVMTILSACVFTVLLVVDKRRSYKA